MTEEPSLDREAFRDDPIDKLSLEPGLSVGTLVDEYGNTGIGAKDVHEAAHVLTRMFDPSVTVVLGLAGPMVPAGLGELIADLIEDGYVDAVATTGATLTHDAIEAIGGAHHHGEVTPPDRSEREHDEQLRSEGVDRIYNVYLPQEHFTAFERHLREHVFPELSGTVTIREVTSQLGVANAAVSDGQGGIAATAAAHDVPIYCPAIQDSILGLQTWMYGQVNPLTIDAMSDMSHLNDLVHEADTTGAFVVGGGVPKNYVLQSMLVTPDAFQYGVQLTMDSPATGGLSGATLNEARSWGKIAPDGENVTVYGDATITLPLVVGAAREWLA